MQPKEWNEVYIALFAENLVIEGDGVFGHGVDKQDVDITNLLVDGVDNQDRDIANLFDSTGEITEDGLSHGVECDDADVCEGVERRMDVMCTVKMGNDVVSRM